MDTRKLIHNRADRSFSNETKGAGYRASIADDSGAVMAYFNHNEDAAELVHRWNAYPELLAALESAELSLTQARIASNIGQPRLKDADFLRGQCDFIAKNVRAAIANATNTH